MEAMKSDLSEKLADFKTVAADLRAGAAELKATVERRHKEMYVFITIVAFGIVAAGGVGLAFLSISLRSVGAG